MRHTRSHSKNRRSHHALAANAVVADAESGELRLPHRLDESTGMYRGKQILPPSVMKKKAARIKRVDRSRLEHTHEEIPASPEQQAIPAEKVENKQEKKTGVMGRFTKGKARARSGMGGGV